MKITVFLGSSSGARPEFEQEAEELGAWIADHGHVLVYGGASCGTMGCLARGAISHRGTVIGIMPQFMVSHGKLLDGLTETIVVPDMESRKQKMLELGEVYLAMPGGPGTLEEIADAYSEVRLSLHHGRLICYGPDGFWNPLQNLIREMKDCGFADQNAADLISFPGTYEQLIKLLTEIAGGNA
ncbi:MAG: TIGR00730 family Rossman fold protein [Bulleidia sp.]